MQEENLTSENTNPQIENLRKTETGMKKNNVFTIVNVALFIGLIVLYFLNLKPGSSPDTGLPVSQKLSSGAATIAYVNSDSILEHYDLVKSMREELEKKAGVMEAELKKKQATFDKDAAYFQEQVNKRTISDASAQEIYAQLMAEQQKLYELREKYSAEIAQQEYQLNLVLVDSLNNFLGRYNEKMGFDYIFSYNRAGNILVANDSLDITSQVLKLINEEYGISSSKK